MASALLQLALTLLIAAYSPNVPQETRNQAILVATQAIAYSEAHPDVASTPAPQPPTVSRQQLYLDCWQRDGTDGLNPKTCAPLE